MVKFKKSFGFALLLTCTTSSADVMLGAYVPGDGFSRERIDDINAVVPKPLSFVNIFSSFSHGWDNLYWQTTNVVSEGAMPLISWMPVDLDNPNENILVPISLGLRDDYIDEWGQRLLLWVDQYPETDQPKVMIRFGHEFNGNWYSYGNSPAAFQMAWQHIHDRFETAGVNQHVEWVWSANNVSVDDYDDITAYYPGTDYVDWTSIDGYNFGTNYSWTDWESFEEVYADTYLTLVNTYPEKPVLIAEVGSAEAGDLPNSQWGQYGNDADGNESKSDWISNMLVNLESSFPAVRAVAWFNSNKELGWSITEQTNTGMAAYIAGVQADHYTSDFLSTNVINSDAPVPPTELELAALDAAKHYELVQAEYEASKSRFNKAKLAVDVARTKNQHLGKLRLDALTESRSSGARYSSSRADYLDKNTKYLDSRDELLDTQSEMLDLRSRYLGASESVKSAMNRYLTKRDPYLEKRNNFLKNRDWFNTASASFVDAVATLEAAKNLGLAEQSTLESAAADAKKQYNESFEKFLYARSEFLVMLENFRDVRSELMTSTEQRNQSKAGFLMSLEQMTQSRNDFLAALANSKSAISTLIEERKIHLLAKSNYLMANEELSESNYELELLEESYTYLQIDYQQISIERSDAYQEMADANYLVSLESNSISNALMLADGSNNDKTDKLNSAKNQSNKLVGNGNRGIGIATLAPKRKIVVKSINKAEQKALAKASMPTPMAAEKAAARKLKFANMSSDEKKMFKLSKMSILNY